MKVLLIWDQFGVEPLSLYELIGDLAELAVRSHGQFINVFESDLDEDAAVFKLSASMFHDDEGNPVQLPKEATKIDKDSNGPFGPYDRIIHAGLIP